MEVLEVLVKANLLNSGMLKNEKVSIAVRAQHALISSKLLMPIQTQSV
jgi:hypothetical protein